MNSNLVPKQIKNIHVVHDLLNDGNKTTYILNLPFKPDIVKIKAITSDCIGVVQGNDTNVKILSNISNDNPFIGNIFFNEGLYLIAPDTDIKPSFVPDLLEFTILDNKDNLPNTTGVTRALFTYDISFIKY